MSPQHQTSSQPRPPSPTPSSPRSSRHVPLLSLAPPALALGDGLKLGEPGDDCNAGEIWNVITRAADLVKDGERLENLAWRHWGQPRRCCVHDRRTSISSAGTSSTTELHTPLTEHSSYSLSPLKSMEKRTFGGALKLLLEEDSNFKDWVSDAKHRLPVPVLSVPDTPVANVEIRLVEPTPVPSRVGSLGASLATGGLLSAADVPPKLSEEEEEPTFSEEPASMEPTNIDVRSPSRSPRKRGKFFVHSSPSKGSGSETSHPSHPSPVAPMDRLVPSPTHVPRPARKSSGSSSAHSEVMMKPKKARIKEVIDADPPPRRNVSLSMMRGRFTAEKRKAAEAIAAKDEDSGWEDEVEDWAEGEKEKDDGEEEGEGEWSDEPDSPEKRKQRRSSSRSRSGRSSSNLDLAHLLTRQNSRKTPPKQTPPPPAPTPLKKMSKKERQAAAVERARIEAELDAQRKREMFAKKQIFGKAPGESTGLLTGLFKRGGSMVDLTQAPNGVRPMLRPSPTHGHLPSLAHSPKPAPNLLRSKSAVAMPIQTGVSVTISPHGLGDEGEHSKKRSSSKGSKGSQDRSVPEGVELESSDEESEAEDNYLANSQTQRKLDELVAKKQAKVQPVQAPGVRFDDNGVVQPISPTTRRRAIIMREMSESLRRNLILEREKSSGGPSRNNSFGQPHARPPPSTHTSQLPTRMSATNLQNYNHVPPIERHKSEPKLPQQPPPPGRSQSNLLGGGFLKPLTRVGQTVTTERSIGRTQSSATLSASGSASPHSPANPTPPEAPAMVRSSTDGDGRVMEREARRRDLAKRNPLDSGYRAHGW